MPGLQRTQSLGALRKKDQLFLIYFFLLVAEHHGRSQQDPQSWLQVLGEAAGFRGLQIQISLPGCHGGLQ